MLLIGMTRSLIRLDNTVEAKLEDINMTNHDDYTNVHDRTNTNNHTKKEEEIMKGYNVYEREIIREDNENENERERQNKRI